MICSHLTQQIHSGIKIEYDIFELLYSYAHFEHILISDFISCPSQDFLDKTQLVSGSWWWDSKLDLSQIVHECWAVMRDLAEIQWRDFINQDPLIYWVYYLVMFVFQYISSRIVYFLSKILWTIFFIVKVEGVPSQQLKHFISLPHDVTVNTHCYKTMGKWWCLGNYTQRRFQTDKCYFTVQMTGINFECSL